MEFNKEKLQKMFPNLAKELELLGNRVPLNSVRIENHVAEESHTQRSACYSPDAVDFIRRCNTEKQAEDIVDYLEKKGEVEKRYAEKLRKQLKEKGVRSFGPKKEDEYYLKHCKC